jgi:hypothetical protein
MKKLTALATALAIGWAAPAMAQDLYFMLTNNTGVPVTAFHVSHTGTSSWEEDLLGGSYLPHGYEVEVVISDGRRTCMYDIRSEFADGDVVEDFNVDLCQLTSYDLH